MRWRNFSILLVPVFLMACETGPLTDDDSDVLTREQNRNQSLGKLFGDDIFTFGGDNKKNESLGITVNEYLWRASLDTVSFIPLRTADPFGGVILTEWYTPASAPGERLKVDIFILDRQLSSNGVRVSIHKQVYNKATKQWVAKEVDRKILNDFEETILTRARQLKVSNKA